MRDEEIKPYSAVFADSTEESAFSAYEFAHNAKRLTLFIGLICIGVLLFVRNDYLFFGLSPFFAQLAVLRAVYILFCGYFVRHIFKSRSFRLLPFWAAATIGLSIFVNLTRPPEYTANAVTDMLFIFMSYVFVPFSMRSRLVFGMVCGISQGTLFTVFRTGLTGAEFTTVMSGFLAANLLGVFAAWNSELRRRHKFHSLLVEQSMRETLKKEADQLARANLDLDFFARAVAHDLKNPLTGVVGLLNVMKLDCQDRPTTHEGIRADVEELLSTTHQMTRIIDSLLMLAGVRHTAPVNVEPVELSAVVDRVRHILRREINGAGATVLWAANWPRVTAVAPWVEAVLTNYLSNAIKYGGDPPEIEVGTTETNDGFVTVWVSDNGTGVAPRDRNSLFEEFYRAKKDGKAGFGIGLSIAERIVRRLGGTVGVDTREAGGSVFWFTLPGWDTKERPQI